MKGGDSPSIGDSEIGESVDRGELTDAESDRMRQGGAGMSSFRSLPTPLSGGGPPNVSSHICFIIPMLEDLKELVTTEATQKLRLEVDGGKL